MKAVFDYSTYENLIGLAYLCLAAFIFSFTPSESAIWTLLTLVAGYQIFEITIAVRSRMKKQKGFKFPQAG